MISLAPLHRVHEERMADKAAPPEQREPVSGQNPVMEWVEQQPALAVALAVIVGLTAGFVVKRVIRGL